MKTTIALIFAALPLSAAITVASVQTTPQQVIIRFNTGADAPTSCTLDLTDGFTSAEAYATNSTLFTGSNTISTSNSIITGHSVQYTGGLREVQTGTDGNRYSLSLGEDTDYTYAIVCPSGTAAGAFHTRPIPLGMTHQDTWVQGTDGFPIGPSILADIFGNSSETGRKFSWIDFQTGARYHMMSMPSDFASTPNAATNVTLVYDATGSGWTIPSGWTAGSLDATTTSGDSFFAGSIFGGSADGISIQCPNAYCSNISTYEVPVQLAFSVQAKSNNPACTGSNAVPVCQIEVGIATDGQSIDSRSQVKTLTLSGTYQTITIGGSTLYDVGQKSGLPLWSMKDMRLNNGNVDCNGTSLVTKSWDANVFTPQTNGPGTYLCIQDGGGPFSNGCHEVATFNNAFSLNFTDTCSGTGHPAGGSAFGYIIHRAATDAFTVSIANPSVVGVGTQGFNPYNQSQVRGAPFDGTDASGNRLQLIFGGESFYAVNRQTGLTTPYAPTQGFPSSGFVKTGQGSEFWPGSSNGTYYFIAGGNLTKQNYFGDYQFPTNIVGSDTALPLWQWTGFNALPDCTGGGPPYSNQPCITHTVIASISTLVSLLSTFDPRFNPSIFTSWLPAEVYDHYIIFNVSPGNGGNFWDYQVVFDVNANNFVASRQVWGPGSRWTQDKGPLFNGRPGWTTNQSPQGPTPAQAQTTSSMATVSCSGFPGTWSSCLQFTLDGDPWENTAGGIGSRGVLGTYMLGDLMWLGGTYTFTPYQTGYPPIYPRCTILAIASGPTITCGIDHDLPTSTGTNQTVWMIPNFPGNFPPYSNNSYELGSEIYWNWQADPLGSNSTGNTVLTNLSFTGAHAAVAYSSLGTGQVWPTADPRCTIFAGNCYGMQFYRNLTDAQMVSDFQNTAANLHTGIAPLFSNFASTNAWLGSLGDNNIQTHPNGACYSLANPACASLADNRVFTGVNGISSVGASPFGSYASIYEVTPSGTVHPKQYDTLFTSGARVYKSVSGPGVTMTDGAPGYYTFCWARVSGDCVTGSTAGRYYVNWPYPVRNMAGGPDDCFFGGGEGDGLNDNWFANDLCGPMDSVAEIGELTKTSMNTYDNTGNLSQTYLGRGSNPAAFDVFSELYSGSATSNMPAAPEWDYYNAQCIDINCRFFNALVRLPRWTQDGVNRADFMPIKVQIKNLPPGASTVAVRFGYAEYNGGKCSPNYNAVCYAVTGAVNDATPFYWKGESFSGLSCSSGCTAAVPALSGHVIYLTTVGLDGSNNEVWVGPTTAQAVP